MAGPSTPQVEFREVLSHLKATQGQKIPTWGIKYTLPLGFPVDKLEAIDHTWYAGRQRFRPLFEGPNTPANKKRADREGNPLIAQLSEAVERAKSNPSSAAVVTWAEIWKLYALEFGMEKPDGRGKDKDFLVRWRPIAPYVGPMDINDYAALDKYLLMLLSEDSPSPRLFVREGEVRVTMTPVSQERYKVLMRALARYAFNKRLINPDAMPRFEFQEQETEKDVWSWEQMRILWKHAPGWRHVGSYLHRFAWIVLSTGQRRGRIEHLKWTNITRDAAGNVPWTGEPGPAYFQFGGAYESTRTRGRSNKRAGAQEITNPELLALLRDLYRTREQDPEPDFVLGELREANEDFKNFVAGISKLCPEAEIPVLSPHHARHSLATHLLGVMRWPTSAVAAFLGCTVRVLEQHYFKIITQHADGVSAAITAAMTEPTPPPAPLADAA